MVLPTCRNPTWRIIMSSVASVLDIKIAGYPDPKNIWVEMGLIFQTDELNPPANERPSFRLQ